MNLGENIFKLRSEKGMSQGDLSNVLEVSRQSVSKWENNSAVPELDKLLKLSDLFDVTLDELVKGKKEPEPEIQPQVTTTVVQQMLPMPSSRVLVGMGLLIFGVVFFLLSIFWGNHLAMGEEMGELAAMFTALAGLAMVAVHHRHVMYTCMVIYFLYAVFSFGFMKVIDMQHYIFMALMGLVLFIWFVAWGMSANKKAAEEAEA